MGHALNHHWEDAYSVIEPQITADSVHNWPFTPDFPIDVRFLRFGSRRDIRMNRHDYLELLYVHSGAVTYQVHDRLCEVRTGDLFLIGSTLLHKISRYETSGMKATVLYFLPEILTGKEKASREDLEYLMPFRIQNESFPHTIAAKTGVPAQVFDLMARAYGELPAVTSRARLSVRTYLRMILILLVNHFADWPGAEDVFGRQQTGLTKLKPVFDYIDSHYAEVISVDRAAELLHLSKSTLMRFFREVTGQSFVGYLNRFRIAKGGGAALRDGSADLGGEPARGIDATRATSV